MTTNLTVLRLISSVRKAFAGKSLALAATLAFALFSALLGAPVAFSQSTTLYSIYQPASGCGSNPLWSGSATSGQAVCTEFGAWDQSQEPTCAIPGTVASSIYSGGAGGGPVGAVPFLQYKFIICRTCRERTECDEKK